MNSRDPPDPSQQREQTFPEAEQTHSTILANPDKNPDGWVELAQFRDYYNLPPFRPPRFSDGATVDQIVDSVESQFDITVEFIDRTSKGWYVTIDGDEAFPATRYRDNAANTVVDMTSETFKENVSAEVESR